MSTRFTEHTGVEHPIICGGMYPCSNPELVAAVSEAGGMGVIQPISMVFAHGFEFREGVRRIRRLTNRPVGFNALIEKTIDLYEKQMRGWIETALEEDVKYFVTALGNPEWVVRLVEQVGGHVYHNVTERKWAEKARDAGVHGFNLVNNRAGGHAGEQSPEQLLEEVADLGLPMVCAGGVGEPADFHRMLSMGYDAVQLGTRFIATTECSAHEDYKRAIVGAQESDIALTDKLSGIPCSIIVTPAIEKMGLEAGPIARRLLRYERTKRIVRMLYSVESMWKLKKANAQGVSFKDYFQAGRSVAGIDEVLPAAEVIRQYTEALRSPAQSVAVSEDAR